MHITARITFIHVFIRSSNIWRSSLVFSSIDRSSVKLFLFSTVLNVTFLTMGFIVVRGENENSVSVVNEKTVVGTVAHGS